MVEPSINKTRIRVNSIKGFTKPAFGPGSSNSRLKKLTNNPIITKTIGAVMIEDSARLEKIPKPRINRAMKTIMGCSAIK
jgi:hypothetical protein